MSSLFCSSQTNDDDQQIIIISFDAFAIPGRSACHLPVGRKLKSNVTLKSSRRRRTVWPDGQIAFQYSAIYNNKKIQKHKNWAKHFTEYENNLKKLAKYFEIFAKVAKFR